MESVASRLDRTRRLLQLAEQAGLGSVWFGEGYPQRTLSFHLPNSLLMLAAVAGSTRLRLGSGVTLLPAWDPLRLAYDAALLDQLSGGRLVLGVGIGTRELWERFGLPTERMGDRADEMLAALRALWRGEEGFRGELVQVRGAVLPRPLDEDGPEVWVGGRVRRSAVRAAQFGNGWYAATSYRLGEVRRMAALYRRAAEAAGRPPGAVAVNRILVLGETRRQAEAASHHVDALLERYVQIRSILDDAGAPISSSDLEAVRSELVVTGDADDVCRQLEAYAAAGVTHLQARIWPSDLDLEQVERTVERLGREVSGRV